ncbi:MAG: gamma-glutamyltransferase [Polyangiales bacterium]
MLVRGSIRSLSAALWLSCFVACAAQPHPTVSAPSAAATIVRRLPAHAEQPGVAVGTHAAVSSAEPQASAVALGVLRAGGNAVDAAVALAFALAVTHPSAGNIGGGGFMLLRTAAGEHAAIDYRETAPLSASRDMYIGEHGELTDGSVLGARAAGVPGTVAGLVLAHERYGKTPWAELVAPAIALARDGHVVDAAHAQSLARAVEHMHAAGFHDSARYYCDAQGAPIAEGATWQQPELAQTLSEIATAPQSFYTGPLAKRIVQQMQAAKGLWTERDLAEYHAVVRQPLTFSYRGHEIITMPPPSAGGIVMRQILYASEQLAMDQAPYRSPLAFHLYVEATRRAYADRNTWLGDPDFVNVPSAGLLDPQYIAARMQTIDPEHATPSSAVSPGHPLPESHDTTHFSVVDEQGAAVSNTYTLNGGFGAKLVLAGTGILLNNEMDDFAANPGKPNAYGLVQGEQNNIKPKKRMLSSMTPTLVLKSGQLRAVLGTPGGPTITTTVVQLVRALLDYGVTLDVAVRAPRVHHQWLPDQVFVEPDVEPEIIEGLKARGHAVSSSPMGRIGHADCIEVDPATQGFRAVADVTRGSGGALAY